MRWEYRVALLPVQTPAAEVTLNGLGAEGWEAFAVHEYIAYLKRPIKEAV